MDMMRVEQNKEGGRLQLSHVSMEKWWLGFVENLRPRLCDWHRERADTCDGRVQGLTKAYDGM